MTAARLDVNVSRGQDFTMSVAFDAPVNLTGGVVHLAIDGTTGAILETDSAGPYIEIEAPRTIRISIPRTVTVAWPSGSHRYALWIVDSSDVRDDYLEGQWRVRTLPGADAI